MRQTILIFILLLDIVCAGQQSTAAPLAPIGLLTARALNTYIKEASVVEIGQIDSFGPLKAEAQATRGIRLAPVPFSYDVCAVIKGVDTEKHHDYVVDKIDDAYYFIRGLLVPGSYVVCAWTSNNDGVSPAVGYYGDPIIPLGATRPDFEHNLSSIDPSTQVIEFIAKAMRDPSLRPILSYTLVGEDNAALPPLVFPYLSDPSYEIRVNAMRALASCQQVAAIPILEKQIHDDDQAGKPTGLLGYSLADYRVPESVPYLCDALFQPEFSSRKGAASALYQIGSPQSIPFLILALHDPDAASGPFSIRTHAFLTLRDLLPELDAVYYASPEMRDDPVKGAAPILSWWHDELLGKHIGPSRIHVAPGDSNMSLPSSVPDIGRLLFQTNAELRLGACAALSKQCGAPGCLPYLMIALCDVDGNVSYTAYSCLVRLAGIQGGARLSKDEYVKDEQQANAPVYAWWASRFERSSPEDRQSRAE